MSRIKPRIDKPPEERRYLVEHDRPLCETRAPNGDVISRETCGERAFRLWSLVVPRENEQRELSKGEKARADRITERVKRVTAKIFKDYKEDPPKMSEPVVARNRETGAWHLKYNFSSRPRTGHFDEIATERIRKALRPLGIKPGRIRVTTHDEDGSMRVMIHPQEKYKVERWTYESVGDKTIDKIGEAFSGSLPGLFDLHKITDSYLPRSVGFLGKDRGSGECRFSLSMQPDPGGMVDPVGALKRFWSNDFIKDAEERFRKSLKDSRVPVQSVRVERVFDAEGRGEFYHMVVVKL